MSELDKRYLDAIRKLGAYDAAAIQENAKKMSGTELYRAKDKLPDFCAAKEKKNMIERKAGQQDGFVCVSSAGRIVQLIQAYDSNTYPQAPEELPAQWRVIWSQDPMDACPFVAVATSPYAAGDCCTHNGSVWRSGQDNNVWSPGTSGVAWEDLGPIEAIMEGP